MAQVTCSGIDVSFEIPDRVRRPVYISYYDVPLGTKFKFANYDHYLWYGLAAMICEEVEIVDSF